MQQQPQIPEKSRESVHLSNPANNTTVMSKCCMYKLIMMYTTTLSTDDQMMPGPAHEKPKSSNLQATIPL